MKKLLLIFSKKIFFLKNLLEFITEFECYIAALWVKNAHKRLMFIHWGLPPGPEFFDHNIDLYYQWDKTKNPLWLERGVFGGLALKGGSVLELSCGDGFNAKNFYSHRSQKVIACDFDPKAIKTAKKKNSAKNIDFVLADIRTQMPQGLFENIVWDAAIEHFTETEIDLIMKDIKIRLAKDGIVSGYTIVEKIDGSKSLHQHEYEFKSKEDLIRFFNPHFTNVVVFETIYPSRHNLYFWASDGILPMSKESEHKIESLNKLSVENHSVSAS